MTPFRPSPAHAPLSTAGGGRCQGAASDRARQNRHLNAAPRIGARGTATRQDEAVDAEQRRDALATTLATVEGTIGVDYRETLAELDRVRTELASLGGRLKVAERKAKELTGVVGGLAV